MPLRMFDEYLGVVNAVPGEQGGCLGCLRLVFIVWGVLIEKHLFQLRNVDSYYDNFSRETVQFKITSLD